MVKLALDHVFLWVQPGSPESARLRELGLQLDGDTAQHAGQGTASVFFSFENAYLELIWIEDPALAPAAWQQRADWRRSGAVPFGIALCRSGPQDLPLPFPSVRRHSAWMRPGTFIEDASASSDPRQPMVLVVPGSMAVPPLESLSAEARQYLIHPLGVRRLTGVRGLVPAGPAPDLIGPLAAAGVVLERADEPALELVFDGGAQGRVLDARPQLPVRLSL